MADDNVVTIAHNVAEEIYSHLKQDDLAGEIYQHMEHDHVKDDFITWFDLALLVIALIVMAMIPEAGAPMTIIPNVAVKGYQVAYRWHKSRKVSK